MAEDNDFVARRIGRIAFGGALIAGFAVLVAPACWDAYDMLAGIAACDPHLSHAAWTIALTWLGAALVGSAASRIAARLSLSRPPDWQFARSLRVPTLGIALLSPLTLHALVWVPLGMLSREVMLFDYWAIMSIWITGVAHLVFAAACARRVSRLAAGESARSLGSVIAITVVVSSVPFVLLLAIPPILVAFTAMLLLPLLRAIDRLVERERKELAIAPLPHAIARPRVR
ncbi:MAG TPA: hypothetical protein VLM79_29490 [Kofleriaceae bacterium]|nr:hypothetical protein [Kofleriaceae bacterium]